MPNMKQVAVWALLLVAGLSLWAWAQGLTADEILDQVEEKSIMGGAIGSMIATVKLDVTAQGEITSYTFKVFSLRGTEGEPDKTLIVYLAPELVSGTMFLTWTPEEGDARMWLYLPALGLVKELITPESRQQEFVQGSGITREDIAQGFKYREDYQAELVGEEEVDGMAAYLLLLTPKEGHKTDWTEIKLWVEEEHFNVLKVESYRDGALAKVITASDFLEDDLGYGPHRFEFQNFEEGTSSVITLIDRKAKEIPEDFFIAEKLSTLQIEGL